jgi:uncharacterized membrane protein
MVPLIVLFYLLFPALVIRMCYRYPAVDRIGAVVLCYTGGIVFGNLGIVPPDFTQYQEGLSSITVTLALPLLLFSMDVRSWSRLAGKALLSMGLATVAVVIIAMTGYLLIREYLPDAWKLAGMAIGVYTGGTPNMAAIRTALNVDSSTFIVAHTYDTAISAVYIVFIITVGQGFFNRFLPRFDSKASMTRSEDENRCNPHTETVEAYRGIFEKKRLKSLGKALSISSSIAVGAYLSTLLIPQNYAASCAILLITSLGISCSFIPKIRSIEKSFQLGMYLIYIFCLVVASMANVKMILHIHPAIMFYIVFAVFGSFLLHALFCRLLSIDTDTFLITSTSAICSPPFVPVVAGALKNREILLSGLTTGIIGYAVGNYLGIFLAQCFRLVVSQ